MKEINLKEIKPGKYQGYLWYSDAIYPTILIGDEDLNIEVREDAFIIEGLLWNSDSRLSVKIDYHDGKQHVYQCEVSPKELDGCDYVTEEGFVSHRMSKIPRLSFLRYWEREEDPLCEGFEVLKPGPLVFIGFDNYTI